MHLNNKPANTVSDTHGETQTNAFRNRDRSIKLTMGTFMTFKALKLVNNMALKQTLTGIHRLAVVMLNGSYDAYPILRLSSTRTVATKH